MKADKLFGTDGIRGTPGEYPLTDGMLFKIGKAAATLLLQNLRKRNARRLKIVIGEDTRSSCYKLETILTSGINSCGVDVISAGVIPTPGLAFLTHDLKADMGLMISASHNRPEDNGIKLFSKSGYKLSESEEEWIENIIFSSLITSNQVDSNKTGTCSKIEDGRLRYVNSLKLTVPDLNLTGTKVILDCGNGAVSNYVPILFEELGAQIIAVGNKPNGMNINVGYGVLYPENMAGLVTEHSADVAFAFDGDGDRLIMCDEKGNVLDGDYIMAIIGINLLRKKQLPKKTVVGTVMTNWGLEKLINDNGGSLVRTPVGDKYILETMRKKGYGFGGEQSGHIIFLNHSTTGDGILTALQILTVMKETNQKLSQLAQCMSKLPQVLINIGVKQKIPFDSIEEISQAITESNDRLKGCGRLLVRYSGTESLARVMVEGKDQSLIKEVADCVALAIKDNLAQ